MQRLVLVRHGQTDHNVERRLQGQIDIPMNSCGESQAAAVGDALAASTNVAAVYSSPLSRAMRTAEAIARPLGLTVSTDSRLLERSFGEWEGLTRPEIEERWPDQFAAWISGGAVEGAGVEPRDEVGLRMSAACRDFHRAHENGTVIVVSHGADISLAITAMLGLDPGIFRGFHGMENCHRAELMPHTNGTETGWVRLASLNLSPDFSATE